MSKIAIIGIVGNSVFLPVDEFGVGGETVDAKSVHFELGGKGFNQAVAAARSGAEVTFCAAVGSDLYGKVSDFLTSEGISVCLAKKDAASAFAAIVTDSHGANLVTVYQGVQLEVSDLSAFEEAIKNADILLLSNEVTEEINIRAIEIAKANGVKCVLNPAPARDNAPYIVENVDLFTPNEHELASVNDRENCIVTLGKRGCLIKKTGDIIPSVDVGKVLDTTGAGDTFNGVLCALLADGKSEAESARAANAVASLGVTRRYAVSSIPTKEEIKEIINNL